MTMVTHLSSKGQVIIPKKIREQHHWHTGLKFIITEQNDSIILQPLASGKSKDIAELVGIAGYKGKRKSLADMDAGIARGAKEHS